MDSVIATGAEVLGELACEDDRFSAIVGFSARVALTRHTVPEAVILN